MVTEQMVGVTLYFRSSTSCRTCPQRGKNSHQYHGQVYLSQIVALQIFIELHTDVARCLLFSPKSKMIRKERIEDTWEASTITKHIG